MEVRRGAFVILALTLAACDRGASDSVTGVPDPSVSVVAELMDPGFLSSSAADGHLDALWARIARDDIPGFAGHYLEDDGRSRVLLSDTAGRNAAVAHVQDTREVIGLSPSAVTYDIVSYDYYELWGFFVDVLDVIVSSDVRSVVEYVDIDEVANRVTVAITSQDAEPEFREAMRALNMPDDALGLSIVPSSESRVETFELASLGSEVTSPFTDIPGGVQIVGVGGGPCTLGVNAIEKWSGSDQPGFITASHCSSQPFEIDATVFHQPGVLTGPQIGSEEWDVGGLPASELPSGIVCPPHGCRWSDSQFSLYDDPSQSLQGRIARTDSAGYLQPGSNDIDPAKPLFGIDQVLPIENQVVGLWVAKVGRTSGWTRGQITQTCITRIPESAPDLLLLCDHRSSIYSEGGDSGSPIFVDGGQGSGLQGVNDWVSLVGILRSGPEADFTVTYFGTIQGVASDMWAIHGSNCPSSGCIDVLGDCTGSNPAFPCQPLSVSIDGPSAIPPGNIWPCLWTANVNGGGGGWVGYGWYTNESWPDMISSALGVNGGHPDIPPPNGPPFTLTLIITNGTDWASDQIEVVVDEPHECIL